MSDVISWYAASAKAEAQVVCADSCLTQNVVLNVPSQDSLDDLRGMCDGIGIESYPFIDAMLFANLIEDDNGRVVALGTKVSPREQTSGFDRVSCRFGIRLVAVISLLYFLVSC